MSREIVDCEQSTLASQHNDFVPCGRIVQIKEPLQRKRFEISVIIELLKLQVVMHG